MVNYCIIYLFSLHFDSTYKSNIQAMCMDFVWNSLFSRIQEQKVSYAN